MAGPGGLLVSPAALAEELAELGEELASEPGPALLDVRWRLGGPPGLDSYREGHLPGAVFIDLERDLAAPPGPAGRHPLPDRAVFTDAMRAAGVSEDRPVVVYDDRDAMAAARAWWLLRYHGHQNVRVLDGGYQAWLAAGLPVTRADPAPKPGDFTARPGHMPVLDAAGAQDVARTGLLLDARAGERYRGEHEPVDPVAGHIPGARNHPFLRNVDARGRFLAAEELRERWRTTLGEQALSEPAAGGAAAARAIAMCGSGVTACHNLLALEVAGLPGARLYAGSWSEWIRDTARPVARGPEASSR